MPVPYSDNLYSAEDSDSEELNVFSPADGYFHASSSGDGAFSSNPQNDSSAVPFVPNVLVEDPSLSEDKAREAEEERLNNFSPTRSGPSYLHTHSRRSVEEDSEQDPEDHHFVDTSSSIRHIRRFPYERTPLISRRSDAPPAYTPSSPTSRQSQPTSSEPSGSVISPTISSGYHTFATPTSTMASYEQQPLLHHDPESMGSPSDLPKPRSLFGACWHRAVHFWQRTAAYFNLRRKLRFFLGMLVFASVLSTVVSLGTWYYWAYHQPTHFIPPDESPVKDPDMSDEPLDWINTPRCQNTPHVFSKVSTPPFRPSSHDDILIAQIPHDYSRDLFEYNPRISGAVVIRPTPRNYAWIDLEVISNDINLVVNANFSAASKVNYFFTIPPAKNWTGDGTPCVQMRVTLWLPNDHVDNLRINTIELDQVIREGHSFKVEEKMVLETSSGRIEAPKQSEDDYDVSPYHIICGEMELRTNSGDILGWFPLYTVLGVFSESGTVDIDIGPKPITPGDTWPAGLGVQTSSGNINVRYTFQNARHWRKPDREFPPRNYFVSMRTVSGHIKADVAVTSEGEFLSQSGDLNLTVWPVLDAEVLRKLKQGMHLSTNTRSGDTNIKILEPLWTSLQFDDEMFSKKPSDFPWSRIMIPRPGSKVEPFPFTGFTMRSPNPYGILESYHESVSGDVNLVYPSTWEGFLWAKTVTGTQHVSGDGLEVSRKGNSYYSYVDGKKGKGTTMSKMKVTTVSGDQTIQVGTPKNKEIEE